MEVGAAVALVAGSPAAMSAAQARIGAAPRTAMSIDLMAHARTTMSKPQLVTANIAAYPLSPHAMRRDVIIFIASATVGT